MACFGAKAAGRWSDIAPHGHFPAMEVPVLLAAELRAFFAALSLTPRPALLST